MNGKLVVLLFICGIHLGSVVGTSEPKVIYRVPEVVRSELEDHSFLRLVTGSGKIYHFTDDATLVQERKEGDQSDLTKLPFLTYGQPHGTNYYIQFPADQTGFKVFIGEDKSGRDSVKGDFKLLTFAGPNRKRYSVAYFNYPLIYEIQRVEDDIVNYLHLVFEYNSQVYSYKFSQSGDEITNIDNCTDSTFLSLAFPNGKVGKIKQYSDWKYDAETAADKDSLAFISFFHSDGAKYDIHFPDNGNGGHPTIARDRRIDRQRCAGSILSRFVGPDGKEYRFEVNDFVPTLSAISPEETEEKVKIHFINPIGQSVDYEFSREGDLIRTKMGSSAFVVHEKPATPFDIKDVEFNCIQNCE